MLSLLFLGLLTLATAGRAPYLGQNIDELKEETKRSGVTAPIVNRPVSAQQRQDYNRYNQKFTDIAKAYAEGYKAAIKAVQARALIAQKRIQASRAAAAASLPAFPFPRSVIPPAPLIETAAIAAASNGLFNMPVPNEVTVNGMEKSGIPHPEALPSPSSIPSAPYSEDHKVVERSAPFSGFENMPQREEHTNGFANVPLDQMSEKARSEITKLNHAARHRNVYFDYPGGATRQNVIFEKKHRKRRSLERHRRSRMPYLGQNLDALGVIRAQINWDAKPNKKTYTPVLPSGQIVKEDEKLPAPEQEEETEIKNARSSIPAQYPMTYGYTYQYPQKQNLQQRSNVPMEELQMGMQSMYPSPYYAGFIPNEARLENINDQLATVERLKKSAPSEPKVSTLNYAARHRKVY